jgi:DnaK suppressor protein
MDDARSNLDLAAIRAGLENELAALTAAREASEAARDPVALDQQSVGRLSRMDAMQVQAMAHAVESLRQGRDARIKAALKRLDEGEYGYCVACGEDIPAKRLELDAATARCVGCSG